MPTGRPDYQSAAGYFTPPSSAANNVTTTADFEQWAYGSHHQELDKLERQFQRYDDILTALPTPTNCRKASTC